MRLNVICLCFLALVLSSCATNQPGARLAADIRGHQLAVRKVVLLGEGVSVTTAEKVAREVKAMVLSSERPAPAPRMVKGQKPRRVPSSRSLKDRSRILQAIADSGDFWEILVAERARGMFKDMLAFMKDGALSNFKGRLLLPESAREDKVCQEQIARVFGLAVVVDYISS